MDLEKEIVADYTGGMSAAKVGQKHGIPAHKVYYVLTKNNVARRSNRENSRRYTVNHDFFEKIDSQDKAYWLGFLFADGCVVGDKISATQKVAETSHLALFVEDVESDYKVKTYSGSTPYGNCEYEKVVVTSKKMRQDLNALGVVERKSLILTPPDIPKNMRGHFIRGYFDGDGSASSTGWTKIRFCGTEEMLDWISDELQASKVYWSKRYADNKNNHQIEIFRKSDLVLATSIMYDDARRFLSRKYNLISKFHSRPAQ